MVKSSNWSVERKVISLMNMHQLGGASILGLVQKTRTVFIENHLHEFITLTAAQKFCF